MGHEVLISKPITHDQLVYIANWMTHYDESFKKLSKEIDSIKNDHVAFIEKKVDVSIKEIKITQSEINCIRKEIEEFKDLFNKAIKCF